MIALIAERRGEGAGEVRNLYAASLDGSVLAIEAALALLRGGDWLVGLGVGPVAESLPTRIADGEGAAFTAARKATDAASTQSKRWAVAVVAAGRGPKRRERARELQALLRILGVIGERRTPGGWAAIDAAHRTGSRRAAAAELGVTHQALSQRLRAAAWADDLAVRPFAARLLAELASS
jgi:hypothetical protein